MPSSIPRTYPELLRRVRATLFAGQRDIEIAWVRTYHETGRLIHCHVLLKKERAGHGEQVIKQLARDTGANARRLYECRQFYRCFPNLRLIAQMGWTRGLLLSQVSSVPEREALVAQALKHDWPTDELRVRVRALNAAVAHKSEAGEAGENGGGDASARPPALLKPRRGRPGLHPVVDRGAGPVVDLGFKNYRELANGTNLAVGDIVRVNDDGVRRVEGVTKADLFTYTATILSVVDADTFTVALTIAPGYNRELKLRLRGLDCPETSTAAGRAAKRFVQAVVHAGDEVILSTTKPDKYERSLADLFVRGNGTGDSGEEIFLNNALLESRHAVCYDGGAKDE